MFNFTNDGLVMTLVDDAIAHRDNSLFCWEVDHDPADLSAMLDIEELLTHLAYEWWAGRFDEPYLVSHMRKFPDDFVGGESFYKLPGANDQDFQKMREAFEINRKMNPNDQEHFDLRQAVKK